MSTKNNAILEKSKKFAIRIIRLYQYLKDEKQEYVLSKQLLRSGTSIGANVREAHASISPAEFRQKLNISLKEAQETDYWLELLFETGYLTEVEFNSIYKDSVELGKMLTKIIKTLNSKL
ncbi:MAG: four helix bundle protein [Candidatus Cloacimonetes bacterium]|nr:four helix bundle protein [Candidatus Cloacimonadota bacterium]